MKSRIMASITIVTFFAFIVLLLVAVVAFPMHIGEPSYYHTARANCLLAACTCGLSSVLTAIASAHS